MTLSHNDLRCREYEKHKQEQNRKEAEEWKQLTETHWKLWGQYFAKLDEVFQSVPDDWYSLNADHPGEMPKRKLTVSLDEPVYQFLRSEGRNWQARMRAILRGYMAHRKAQTLDSARPMMIKVLAADYAKQLEEMEMQLKARIG